MGILPSALRPPTAASFFASAPLSLLAGLALSQFRPRGRGDVAVFVDRSRFGNAGSTGRGQPVHRAVPIEIERIVAPALPWLRLGAGAAPIAPVRRARAGQKCCR